MDATYTAHDSALLIIDPYNDFMSEGGKLYELTKATAQAAGFYENLPRVIEAVRAASLRVFIVPHRRWRPGDYAGWLQTNLSQQGVARTQLFAEGSWGGEFNPVFGPRPGDIIVHEHWAQSGFANTDLDAQLKLHGIRRIILVGMVANTCVESTARFGMELGYHVTLVSDATAAFSAEGMHAAHAVNGPSFAHAILSTHELLAALPRGEQQAGAGRQVAP